MSFIIRIMLDWEMQQEQIPVVPIFIKPSLTQDDIQNYVHIQFGNNYSSYNRLNHVNLEVFSKFSSPAA